MISRRNYPVFLLFIFVLLSGCGHTQSLIGQKQFQSAQTGITLGVEYVFDVNQFNYAPSVREEIIADKCFRDVLLTHKIDDSSCDYVVRGNFTFYKVSTRNTFYHVSVYLFLIPLLSGIPYAHIDGGAQAEFEIYQKGKLIKTYEYEDVFWEERGLFSVYPSLRPERELRRLTRLLVKDILKDFFGIKRLT